MSDETPKKEWLRKYQRTVVNVEKVSVPMLGHHLAMAGRKGIGPLRYLADGKALSINLPIEELQLKEVAITGIRRKRAGGVAVFIEGRVSEKTVGPIDQIVRYDA